MRTAVREAGREAGAWSRLCCSSFSPQFGTHLDTLGPCPLPRIKVKKGLHVTAARLAQPGLWTAKLDRFKASKHHTTLITCHRVGPVGPDSRWATPSWEKQRKEGAGFWGPREGDCHAASISPHEQVQNRHLQGNSTGQRDIRRAIYPCPVALQ